MATIKSSESESPIPTPVQESIPWEGAVKEGAKKAKVRDAANNIKPKDIPSELGPRWELIVNEAAKRLKAKRDMIKTAIGEKPYQALPIDPVELENRYLQIRNDPDLQAEALSANIIKSPDGKILIKKAYLQAISQQEEKIRKGAIGA